MSSLVTRPWAPVPWTSSRLTPSLAAMLRTSGLENLRSRSSTLASPASISLACADSPESRWTSSFSSSSVACSAAEAAGWAGCGAGAGAPSRAVSSRFTSAAAGCCGVSAAAGAGAAAAGWAPASPIIATTWLTGTVSPSWLRISSSVPEAGLGISASTLSVEISNSG